MRARAEWLLLPLFLLPFLAAGALVALVARNHEAELDAIRHTAPERIRAWLTPPDGAASWMPARVGRAYVPGGVGLGDAAAYAAVLHPRGALHVRLPGHGLGAAPWQFSDALPEGLPAALLGDPTLRLDLETGTPAGTLDGVDDATNDLAGLLDRPDLARLRSAPLPASTKGYLLRRWRGRGASPPWLADAVRLVGAVRTWEVGLAARGGTMTPGVHLEGSTLVVVASRDTLAFSRGAIETRRFEPGMSYTGDLDPEGTSPFVLTPTPAYALLPDGAEGLPVQVFTEADLPGSDLRLHWVFPPDAPVGPHEVWRGRLEAPLAGTFVLTAPGGTAWWQASGVRRWGPVALALLLASLVVPALLFVAMRRRRLLDEARVRFVNEMAHDLRTPLASLRLQADLLAQGKGKPGGESVYVDRIAQETARLGSLLENLLDVSRLEGGARRFDLGIVVLRDVVEDVLQAFAVLAPRRPADVSVEGEEDARVRADRAALARVLSNLLDNAAKFTDVGTPIHVRWSEHGDRVTVQVADEGGGIPANEKARVFERYERGCAAREQGVAGSGLGLALVRELVEGMGGRVRLREAPRGATFEIELPSATSSVGGTEGERDRA